MIGRSLLLVCWLFAFSANAYIYNDSLLLIYAKLIPKIMQLDHTERKGAARPPRLCILYEEGDGRTARKLETLIRSNLPKKGELPLQIVTKRYSQTDSCGDVSAFVLLNTRSERARKAIGFAASHRLLSFAYDSNLLEEGAIVSLHAGKRVFPIVNIDAIKKNRLQLDPLLFQVAKIYGGGGS
jgi:hypothetical protein